VSSRLVEVAPERLPGWVERFTASHGPVVLTAATERLVLAGDDGEVADLEVPWPPLVLPGGGSTAEVVVALADHAARPRTALLVLVRRGGWAVGLARAGEVLDGLGGTRYVQSRTAAGGWSQQRYARRRANQADGLVGAAAGGLARVLLRGPRPDVVVPGGDRQLVADVLGALSAELSAELRAAVVDLPRGPLLDVADPRRRVLDDAAARARCVRVRVGTPG